jgi:hypothetical protein
MRMRSDVVCFVPPRCVVALAVLISFSGPTDAGEKGVKLPAGPSKVATATSGKGSLLVRWPADKPWSAVPQREELYAGEPLLALPGTFAEVVSAKKSPALKLQLIGNLPGIYRSPALETEVRLNEAKEVDLDFTLERGRVVLSHTGAKGTTLRCRVRFQKQDWILQLTEPGTRVSVELIGRRLPWSEFPKKPDPNIKPDVEVNLLVLAGSAELAESSTRQTLGPLTLYHWRSEVGAGDVNILRELPAEMTAATDARAKKLLDGAKVLQGRLADKRAPAVVLSEALQDKDEHVRTVAVFGLAAVGDTPTVLQALADPKHADTRQAAVLALRHWVGQSYDEDQRLYEMLLLQKYSKAHAEIVVQLLHNFTLRQLAHPETYEALIHYLTNDRLAIRQLAWWHLTRLVPDGDRIAYDPAGAPVQLRQGQALWRKRIPEGKLPTAPVK